MSSVQNLPTESEIKKYQSKKNDDIIVMDIYNGIKEKNDDSTTDANQTEANLKLDDNYNYNNGNIIINYNPPNKNNNIVFFDNTRENPYPFSENRGINKLNDMPPQQTKNKFAKSLNPFKKHDFPKKEIETNKLKSNEENKKQLSKEKINVDLKSSTSSSKKKSVFTCGTIFACIFYTLIFPPCGIIYLCGLIQEATRNR